MKPQTLPHYHVNHLSFLIRKELAQRFGSAGIQASPEEWALLLLLQDQADGMTATDLSDRSLRDKTTVTRMVDKLVAKGWAARHPSDTDRRRVVIRMTDGGHAAFGQMAICARDLIDRSLAGIDPDDLAITVRTLARMTGALTSAGKEHK